MRTNLRLSQIHQCLGSFEIRDGFLLKKLIMKFYGKQIHPIFKM